MTTPPEALTTRRTFGSLLATSFRHGSAIWLLVFIVILFSITAPNTFPTLLTAQIVLSDQVTVALLALAVLVPLASGNFDFSIGAFLALGMSTAAVLINHGMGALLASVIAVALTTFFSFIAGFFVVKLHVSSFIATLGMSQVATAAMYLITQNLQIVPPLPYWFTAMTRGKLLGINFDVYYLLGIAVIIWYVLEHTAFGRSVFAAGGNPEAARLAGVRVDRLTWITLMCSGAISGLAGVLLLSKVSSFTQEYGPNFLFAAFAAVFFGATQIKGRPNVWGAIIAVYVLATAVAGLQLTFFGNEYWITPVFNGIALLIAVSLASRKHAGRAYRKLRKGKTPTAEDYEHDQDVESSPAVPAAVERGYE